MAQRNRTANNPNTGAALLSAQLPPIDLATQGYSAWLEQTNRVRDEALRFAQERFAKGLEAVVQLAECRDPATAFAVQAEFASKAAADYLAEGQKMIELMSYLAQDGFTKLQQGAETGRAS